jgi:hypothetical protein
VPIVVVTEVGMTFESEKDGYDIYNNYIEKIGFSIRKSDTYRRADKIISSKLMVYSKQGSGSTRTTCNARIQFNVSREGIWTVQKILPDHNHYLASLNKTCKLRSQRHIIEADRQFIAQIRKPG